MINSFIDMKVFALMTGYFQTNYNYYQDQQTTQDPEQAAQTSKKLKNETEKGEMDVAGKCTVHLVQ
jgi:hypothetical protein